MHHNHDQTPRPESLQGELQPHSAKAKIGDHTMASRIDDQTVFSQLDMDIPEGAFVKDNTIADNAALDERVKKTLHEDPVVDSALELSAREYRNSGDKCSRAVGVLASVLLPAIFEDNQASLVASYKDTINRNPWLVKVLIDAYNKQKYDDIRRIGLLRQLDRLSTATNPSCRS